MDGFPLNYDENTPKDGLYDNMDYKLKARVVEWMNVLSWDISGIVSRCGVKRKELCRIWAEYGVAVLKTFRTQYDPELKQKQARMKEEYDKMSAERTLRLVQERELSLFCGADPRSIYYNNKLLSNEDGNNNCNIWKRDWNLRLWRCWSVFIRSRLVKWLSILRRPGTLTRKSET